MDISQPSAARRPDGVTASMPGRLSRGWPLLVVAWMLLVGAAVALRPILPVDETRYVSVAWEMWLRGDFLVPHLNGLPYSEKPPLLFWLFQAGWWFFGVNDWWPRIVPALFSLANLALTARLARRLWPDRPEVERNAPAVLLGLLLWTVFTTMMMFDMLVAFAVLAALLGLEEAWRKGGVRPWLQVGGALGLGILAKGPVALVLPLLVAFAAPWWGREMPHRRQRPRLWRTLWWIGVAGAVAVAAGIALAWALPAARAGGTAYADAILVAQTRERVVNSFAHERPWWWYLALLPGVLFPYSVWPPLWRNWLRRRPVDPGIRFCLAWLVPGMAAFSLISGKQPHYLLPLLPAFGLLASRVLAEPEVSIRRSHLALPLAGVATVGLLMAAAPSLKGHHLPPWMDRLSPGAGVALVLLAVFGFAAFDRVFARRVAGPTLICIVLVLCLLFGFSEAARTAYDLEPVARYLKTAEEQGRPIAWVGDYHGQLHFLGRLERPLQEIPSGSESLWIRQNPRGKVVQDLDYVPPDVERAEFTQPYRDDVLAVWGREGISSH